MVAVNAHAVENITPFLLGVTIGVPVGALPPPGLYFASANTVFDMNVKNDQGQNTGIHVLDPSTNEALLYVPDIPKIFGATYGALIPVPAPLWRLTNVRSAAFWEPKPDVSLSPNRARSGH